MTRENQPEIQFDGPRLLRPGEKRAAHRLSAFCFGGSPPPEAEEEPPAPPVLEPEPAPTRRPRYETYLIAADGKPVSLISLFITPLRVYDSVLQVGSIGGVCTHPDYRGYGLASRLLDHCARRLQQGGAHLMVISGGRGLYRRAGCEPMGRFAGFTIHPGELPAPGQQVTLRPADPTDAALCAGLYQAEPIHFVRPLEKFAERFQPHPLGFHAEEYIVDLEGRPAAYLLLNVDWDKRPEAGIRFVSEYAGSRAALSAALASASGLPQIRELEALIPWQDLDLIHLLTGCGPRPHWTALPDHTIRILNFPALMSALRPYIQARLDPALRRGLRFEQTGPLLSGLQAADTDRFTIRHGGTASAGDCLDLNGAQMTRLVLGGPDAPPPTPGALGEIIRALFPLPAFVPGLDYH